MSFHCTNLTKSYTTQDGVVQALADVTFNIREHEFVCLVGPSGCGKTTLLKLIAGLVSPSSGSLEFNNGIPDKDICKRLVFQDQGLFPWMTVLDNVAFGLRTMGVDSEERQKQASEFIRRFGLEEFIHSYPHELSGGMRQRVAVARALLTDPHILLMDEPFGALDAQARLLLQNDLLLKLNNKPRTVIYVTHDIDEAIAMGDRVLVMSGRPGKIVEDITISTERPRQLLGRTPSSTSSQIKWHIWNLLENETRKTLRI